MTEELLQAAILRLRAKALEHYGMIKDLYHNPASEKTVDDICSHAVALAQYEGAMLTLQGYSANIAEVQQPTTSTEQPAAEDFQLDVDQPDSTKLSQEELEKRSPTMRRSAGAKKKTYKSKSK
tara:strand:- start:68 stop:436 length:369 start_codon:yes stop_codon:yes gene_type:complete